MESYVLFMGKFKGGLETGIKNLTDMLKTNQDYVPAMLALAVGRTLRPLRFISHNASMKIVVKALMESIGAILNCLLVFFLVYLMFGILGTFFLKNKMGYCDLDDKYK